MNRPLRVAWVTFFPVEWLPEAPDEIRALPKGHPASWQRVLLREFQKDPSLELHIFAIRKTFKRDVTFKLGNATFYCLKAPGSLRAPSLFWVDTWLLKPHIRRIQPDVVHAWGTEQAAGLVASRMGVPYLLTIQGMLTWLSERVRLNRYDRFMGFLERRCLPKAQKVTVEARFAVEFLQSKWPKLKVEQIEHAPDPLFASMKRANESGILRFLSMGGINELKGADILLRSLADLSSRLDFRLVAIGNYKNTLARILRSELPSFLFDRIVFRDRLTPEEVAREMSKATMLLYPTRGDTSPNSVKEAAIHGLPVISADVGGINEYVVDGENGILFGPDSQKNLTDAIERAVRHPLFSQGRVEPVRLATVRNQLSSVLMAQKFSALYLSLRR